HVLVIHGFEAYVPRLRESWHVLWVAHKATFPQLKPSDEKFVERAVRVSRIKRGPCAWLVVIDRDVKLLNERTNLFVTLRKILKGAVHFTEVLIGKDAAHFLPGDGSVEEFDKPVTIDFFHFILTGHPIKVLYFRRR